MKRLFSKVLGGVLALSKQSSGRMGRHESLHHLSVQKIWSDPKIILVLALVGTGVLVFWQVTWVYQNIQSDIGSKTAETSLADHIVICWR